VYHDVRYYVCQREPLIAGGGGGGDFVEGSRRQGSLKGYRGECAGEGNTNQKISSTAEENSIAQKRRVCVSTPLGVGDARSRSKRKVRVLLGENELAPVERRKR